MVSYRFPVTPTGRRNPQVFGSSGSRQFIGQMSKDLLRTSPLNLGERVRHALDQRSKYDAGRFSTGLQSLWKPATSFPMSIPGILALRM
jgi:hypothetical protein